MNTTEETDSPYFKFFPNIPVHIHIIINMANVKPLYNLTKSSGWITADSQSSRDNSALE